MKVEGLVKEKFLNILDLLPRHLQDFALSFVFGFIPDFSFKVKDDLGFCRIP